MKREILAVVAAMWGVSANAADSGHCDSKPFTLKKPVVVETKPAPPPPAAAPKLAAAKPVATKMAKTQKSKYVIGCKQPKD